MTEEQRRASLLNRMVLAYTYIWLKQHTERMNVDMPEICYKLKSAGYASKVINGFSDDERRIMDRINETKEFQDNSKVLISLVVMALEVMKNHVEAMPQKLRTPKLNISDKKLVQGKAAYTMYMLKAKRVDKQAYDTQKEVIDTTAEHASSWYNFMKNAIMSGEFEAKSDGKS